MPIDGDNINQSSLESGLAFCLSNNLAYARIMQTETITTKWQDRGKTQDLTPAPCFLVI
jgi:hypothetical protein